MKRKDNVDTRESGYYESGPNILAVITLFVAMIGVSWLITCGAVKLIMMCFGLEFSWAIATGIWLCLWLLGSTFGGKNK